MSNKFGSPEHMEEFKDHVAKHSVATTVEIALLIFKNLILVNGGALAGVLTYIATTRQLPGADMTWAAGIFSVGLVLAMLSLASFYYNNAKLTSRIICTLIGSPTASAETHQFFKLLPDILGWLSMCVFVGGLFFGARALVGW